jgi:hypothetical protein
VLTAAPVSQSSPAAPLVYAVAAHGKVQSSSQLADSPAVSHISPTSSVPPVPHKLVSAMPFAPAFTHGAIACLAGAEDVLGKVIR